MAAPVDPYDFLIGQLADADLIDARFLVLYNACNAAAVGLDAASIKDGIISRTEVETQPSYSTLALTGATWTPANLSYWKDSLGIVHFRPEKFTATADFANGATFGTMPVGFRPGVKLYFPGNRVPAAGFGSMHFAIDAAGVMTAVQNFNPLSSGIAFSDVEYRAEN